MATAPVIFTPLRSGLVNLPLPISNVLFNANTPPQNVVIELSFQRGLRTGQHSVFVGWTGMSSKDTSVEIDPTFAQNVELPYGIRVSVQLHTNTPPARQVFLEPLTVADWEIVETHAAFLENWMVTQVRAVSVGHVITVFPSATAIAALKVTRVEPSVGAVVRVGADCEAVIAPKVKVREQQDFSKSSMPKVSDFECIWKGSAYPYGARLSSKELVFCGQPDQNLCPGNSYSVSAIRQPKNSNESANFEYAVTPAKRVNAIFEASEQKGISAGLACALEIGGQINVSLKVGPPLTVSSGPVIIRPLSEDDKVKTKRNWNGMDISQVGNGLLLPPNIENGIHHGAIVECVFEWGTPTRVELGADMAFPASRYPENIESIEKYPEREIVGREKLIEDVVKDLVTGAGVLVYGSRGCGKTSFIDAVARSLRMDHGYATFKFHSNRFGDKSLSQVRDAILRLVRLAAWQDPAVILCDDLDRLIPPAAEQGDSGRSGQIAEFFISAIESVKRKQVTILVSAQDQSALNKRMIDSHFFESTKKIGSPDKDLREAIILKAAQQLGLSLNKGFDTAEITAATEGYQPGDLWVLAERLATLSSLRNSTNVDTSDFLDVAKDFTPASLRGVQLTKASTNWYDIGGLAEAKRILLETLEWPTKYAPIFANCPLRLRSGILLYGFPGCGKTLLASAIASQCGLNFINVKGPEILNKYIGASEKSVRDLFDRAQAAKPCIIFFDEFDSIAPKRGHDSTGVTDRVVNQLLTQMDGAEGLDGVYVLAATSRPDLIDSALLRPGRLDKSIICDMPSSKDRFEILKCATQKIKVGDDVDLQKLADLSEGYTGADLQALMYNANLDAIHDLLDTQDVNEAPGDSNQDPGVDDFFQVGHKMQDVSPYLDNHDPAVKNTSANTEVIVNWAHLEKSLAGVKRSVPPKEVARLRNIYREFLSDRDGQMPSGTSSNDVGGRVTLS